MTASARLYLVECFWPTVTQAKVLAASERAAADSSATCVDVVIVVEDEIVLCLFEAPSEQAAWDAATRAGLPCERIVESVRITPRCR